VPPASFCSSTQISLAAATWTLCAESAPVVHDRSMRAEGPDSAIAMATPRCQASICARLLPGDPFRQKPRLPLRRAWSPWAGCSNPRTDVAVSSRRQDGCFSSFVTTTVSWIRLRPRASARLLARTLRTMIAGMDPERASLTIPFFLRHFDGSVAVHYAVNDDPTRWGMQYLGIAADVEELQLARGFPVLLATVQYAAEGYAAELQWIQLVSTSIGAARAEVMCDTAPQMTGVALPFMSFGVNPVLFDAPVRIQPGLQWRAESFLTCTPDVLMSKIIEPVCGFTWGFDVEDSGVRIKDLAVVEDSSWSKATEHLAQRYPDWRFEPGCST
jgi:hypothetical protein